jgi:PIF1-like helicase
LALPRSLRNAAFAPGTNYCQHVKWTDPGYLPLYYVLMVIEDETRQHILLRAAGKPVLYIASSGIAAAFLPYGRLHTFSSKIPLTPDESSTCDVKKGRLLAEADLIVWDEVLMQYRFAFEAVHRLFWNLLPASERQRPLLWGAGATGDFTQTLPIVLSFSAPSATGACCA